MTSPENFVSRWARMKRESDSERPRQIEGRNLQPGSIASLDMASASAPSRYNEVAVEPLDAASLPPIESITVNTDIRAFLQSGVPAELTRAALRQAWASDPAIRDFIGIAEGQWDFNDPNAIPGFGPLQGTDNLQALLEQAIGGCDELAETFPGLPVSQAAPAVTDRGRTGLDQGAPPTPDGSPAIDPNIAGTVANGDGEGTAISSDRGAERGGASNRRCHGSALPRFEI